MRRSDNTPLMRAASGMPAILLGSLAWLIMALTSIVLGHSEPACGGLLLMPPATWGLSYTAACLLTALLTALCTLGLWLLNKSHLFLPGPGGVYLSIFPVLCASAPVLTTGLSPGIITLAIVMPACHLLFSLNARRQPQFGCLTLFSLLSWGSMVQSACLLLMPLFLLGMIMLRVGRVRDLLAALTGALVPLWIVYGFCPESARIVQLPTLRFIGGLAGSPAQMLPLLAPAAIATLLLIILVLYNALYSMSEGVRMRALHSFINLLGIGAAALMVLDCDNMPAYIGVLFMCLAYVMARSFILSRSPRAWLLPLCTAIIFITQFILLT